MNNQVNTAFGRNEFIRKDRARLLIERNKFKAIAENLECDLHNTRIRSRNVIVWLLLIIVMLFGVIAYVSKIT